jgi:hypothetical protein
MTQSCKHGFRPDRGLGSWCPACDVEQCTRFGDKLLTVLRFLVGIVLTYRCHSKRCKKRREFRVHYHLTPIGWAYFKTFRFHRGVL